MCALTTRTLTAAYVGAYVGDAYVGDAYVGAYVMDDRRRALAAISRSRPVRRDCPQTRFFSIGDIWNLQRNKRCVTKFSHLLFF